MRLCFQWAIGGVIGLGGLALTLGALLPSRFGPPLGFRAPAAGGMTDEQLGSPRSGPPAPRNAFEKAMREARRWNMQAWREVNEERYAVEAWDREAAESLDQRDLRRELLAADRSGSLLQARLATQQAATLARTPQERYRAALLLTKLSGEAGHYAAALAEAQRLVALAPRSQDSLLMLRQAAQCNGMTSLVRQADAALKALQEPQFAVRKFSMR
jgi:uncharacterized membrane protein